MTHQAILEKAIQKAIEGGWRPLSSVFDDSRVQIQQWQDNGMVTVCIWNDQYEYNPLTWVRELEGIIFNHDFARALWGKAPCFNGVPLEALTRMAVKLEPATGSETVKDIFSLPSQPLFEWHLQQMVIADDPIKYLGEHL